VIHHTKELQAELSEHCEYDRNELEKNFGAPIPQSIYSGGTNH